MAKIMGVNHIAFVVKDLNEAVRSARENLGGEMMMKFESLDQKYVGACVQLGESIVSFLQATDASSFVAKHLEEKGAGVQHIGLEIDDLEEYVKQLEAKGIRVDKTHLKDKDFPEALVGPRVGYGVVLQLMQWKAGSMDVSPEGKKRLIRKYQEVPGLRLIE